ncbi:MAG: bifunctional riboflavin kinase/FAD synthetase [Bacilli bacterium]|nr:bifunctional riboflavin kinase/FAD synthetase [Bacilli bacterium]MBN2877496.1 bifunctional riboflavin kinase/FAD synthetase [Bacilli bacterium]
MLRIKYLEYNDFLTEQNSVICLGYFDGMHIAHVELIKTAAKLAKEKGLSLAVFTFSMNIKAYLNQERHRCLTTVEDKATICKKLGVDYLYVMKVSQHLIHMQAEEFIERFLVGANTVVVGFDFRFGYRGEGDRKLLLKQKNFQTIVIPEMTYLDLKVGTTRIRANLLDGNLEIANHLLGREYKIKGRVVSGRGIGRRLGYPTANIDYMPYVLPKSGVYYTKVIHEKKEYYGITNVGNNPTYFNVPLTVETHVFNTDKNLYNEIIEVRFVEYLRPEIKFDTEPELIEQIYQDIELVKTKFKEANHA